jgi:hypothetical protein
VVEAERDALLVRALEYAGGTHTVADVLTGPYQIWEGAQSVVVTQVVEHPRLKEAFAFLAAGNLEEIRALYPNILAWAKAMGCTRASFLGRPGWSRSFLTRDEGWHTESVVYSKEL